MTLSTKEDVEVAWDGCHIKDLQLEELEEMPEIAYKLGIVPHDWKNETAGIWADNELEEAVLSGVRVSTTLPTVALVR